MDGSELYSLHLGTSEAFVIQICKWAPCRATSGTHGVPLIVDVL